MGSIITFINEKGGIGKTSCCFNTAWELAKSKKVLMIDLDGQRANLTYFTGIQKSDDMVTMYNILQTGSDIRESIITVNDGLFLIPATVNVANLNQNAKITRMKKSLAEIKSEYDYIFIDVNPTPNWSHVLALSSSDYIIIPMLPDIASLEANNGISESIEEVQETTNPNLKVLGILFNKNNSRTNLSKQVNSIAEKMAIQLESKVFKTKIRNTVALSENVYLHQGVTDYSPKSTAADDIRNLVIEIEKEILNNV